MVRSPTAMISFSRHLLGKTRHLFVPRASTTSQQIPQREIEDKIEHQIELKRLLQRQKYRNNNGKNVRKLARDELRSLRELATEVSLKANDGLHDDSTSDSTEKVFEAIHSQNLISNPESKSSKYVFPSVINDKLGLASTYLIPGNGEFKPQWALIVQQLELSGGFTDLDTKTVHAFVKTIPPADLKKLVPQLIQMCSDAEIEITPKIELLFFKSLATGGTVTSAEIQSMEAYFERFLEQNEQKPDYYETMICGYIKNGNMKKVEKLLNTMQLKNVEITRSIFSSILQGYIYYTHDHAKAWETFNAMKFLSKKTQPNERNYTDMVFSFVKSNRLEGALDLYQEMLDNNIALNQNVLASLARGCCKSKRFSTKSWDFVFKIYDQGLSPNLQTYESMLNISALEGSVDLTRALFAKLIQTNSVTSKAVLYLMMSYSKHDHSSREKTKRSAIEFNERGRIFKQNVMQDVDFSEIQGGFPFLPLISLPNNDAVLAEATAIVTFIKDFKPWLLTPQLVTSFLNTCVQLGSMEGFLKHYENLTCLEATAIPKSGGDGLEVIDKVETNLYRISRDTPIYITALKAAAKFKNYDFAMQLLKERGCYRKSIVYQSKPKKIQHVADFEFARALVECFKDLKMLKDALSIVLSSEEKFPWSWKELGGLVGAALTIEDLQMVETIKRVIRNNNNRR
ncbi:hypothetical protein CANMA_003992 [Candida margitis]|uniref:uncharacterized protein n=1 Tax=Candida margitis TaxID=1775924 RepID=UPI002225D888|nr:uncharacterized protein CANMA_003992 [Candida margitis]KAI5960683.1 hypothetical protein CANMA_003992 [Candida margitis]